MMTRTRWLKTVPLVLALALTLTASPVRAQAPAPPPEPGSEESGRPLDGYLATAALIGIAMFSIGRTARRS